MLYINSYDSMPCLREALNDSLLHSTVMYYCTFGAMHIIIATTECSELQYSPSHKQPIYIVPKVCDCYNCARLLPLRLYWDTGLRLLHWHGYEAMQGWIQKMGGGGRLHYDDGLQLLPAIL